MIQKTLEQRLDDLANHLLNVAGNDPVAGSFIRALHEGRFTFERETWYTTDACRQDIHQRTPGELVIRAHERDGTLIKPQTPIFHLYEMGHHQALDHFVVLCGLTFATHNDWAPVSVNISARHTEDDSLLVALHRDIDHFFHDKITPDEVIFEVLEDYTPDEVIDSTLEMMQDLGYRFALDDMSDAPEDSMRQRMLLPHCDFAKIDGSVVEQMLKDKDSDALKSLQDNIKQSLKPGGAIVMERVQSPADADQLRRKFNAKHVQGWPLTELGFDAFRDSVRGGLEPSI